MDRMAERNRVVEIIREERGREENRRREGEEKERQEREEGGD